MLKIEWLVLCTVLLLCACNAKEAGIKKSIHQYYDLKGLIESQVEPLDSVGSFLHKNASIDGHTTDKTVYKPDTVQWKKELNLFLEADINKTTLVNSYNTQHLNTDTGEVTRYISKYPGETDVDTLEIEFNKTTNLPETVNATIRHRNTLYSSLMKLQMFFHPLNQKRVLLHQFVIDGGQKMITKDTTTFQIKGDIVAD